MKRDMDLVRKLLIRIEEDWGYEYLGHEGGITIEGYSHPAIHYHLGIMIEAGLIASYTFPEGLPQTSFSTYIEYLPEIITWEGHEFLEGIRKEETWETIKKEATNLSFAAIKSLILLNMNKLVS